jgi:hypothetical protein
MIIVEFELVKPIESDPSFWYYTEYKTQNVIAIKYTRGILYISKFSRKLDLNESDDYIIHELKISDYLESMMDFNELKEQTKKLIDWSLI